MTLTSKLCNAADFTAPWFLPWRPFFTSCEANGVRLGGSFLHRKEWEFVVTAQALRERGMLAEGRTGIGFAVGREPLPALFARHGCAILASDYPSTQGGVWSGQWAAGLEALQQPAICPEPVFAARVRFTPIDMRAIPENLSGFDFAWSCCALEHLGSLRAGQDFLLAQCACLKPGGVAVHSFEFNLSDARETIETGPTVLYRPCDVEAIAAALHTAGHTVEAIDFHGGTSPEDQWIAVRPFHDRSKNPAHLRLRIGRYIATSMVLIVTIR